MQDDDRPLSREELRQLRKILDQDEKMQWLWSVMRRWAAGILAITAGAVAFRDDLALLLHWMFSRGGS